MQDKIDSDALEAAARVIQPEDVPLRARHFALANALDKLREAVRGCGATWSIHGGISPDGPCGRDYGRGQVLLCPSCNYTKLWPAISQLLGTSDGGEEHGG